MLGETVFLTVAPGLFCGGILALFYIEFPTLSKFIFLSVILILCIVGIQSELQQVLLNFRLFIRAYLNLLNFLIGVLCGMLLTFISN